MAEIKNSFLRSKMNKDLDDRLIPNGEYRDAQNISVGKSEDDDIGALENVLGNALIEGSQLLTFNNLVVAVNSSASNAITVKGNILVQLGMTITGLDTASGLKFASIVTSVTYNAGADTTSIGIAYSEIDQLANTSKVDVFFPLEVIGSYSDKPNNRVIIFLTSKDVNQQLPSNINNYFDPLVTEAQNFILSYTPNNPTNTKIQTIAKGRFLNFSVNFFISGIDMIENLLFFTDDYNQPRQVNVKLGIESLGTYYTNEDHVSVAKYAPYLPVDLFRKTTGIVSSVTTQGTTPESYVVAVPVNTAITTGMSVVSRASVGDAPRITGDDFIYVAAVQIYNFNTLVGGTGYIAGTNVATIGGTGTGLKVTTTVALGVITAVTITSPGSGYSLNDIITISRVGTPNATIKLTSLSSFITLSIPTTQTTTIPAPVATDIFTFITSSMTNESLTSNWPGDPDFLQDKFIRFSYRFKFADNEYSIIAPFSQIAFVPNQKGYFFQGDEDDAYQSTVVNWMENFIQQVQLFIPLPDAATNVASSYKISEIDILYKESDALAIKVVETINAESINGTDITNVNTNPIYFGDGEFLPNNVLVYTYESQKPYKTLPTSQTTRVYDKVPVKALAQASAGNRIIYGNYFDKHTPPASINYNVAFIDKDSNLNTNWIEYPNHSVKQNRNYQVGFILADRYGRQSPVILSSINQSTLTGYVGSTVYAPYEAASFDVKGWFGKALQVSVNAVINPPKNLSTGEPGLYNAALGTNYNPLGWYSYKVVVRQREQDYYNVYLPGILDGYPKQISLTPITGVSSATYNANATIIVLNSPSPAGLSSGMVIQISTGLEVGVINSISINGDGTTVLNTSPLVYSVGSGVGLVFTNPNTYIPFPIGEQGKTAHTVLFNDNINKIPRDLAEVGPEQKQFRSSVQLFGRVTNTMSVGVADNKQFYGISPVFARASQTVITIGEAEDLNIIYSELANPGGQDNFYQIDTNPLIARISTPTPIGVVSTVATATNMKPFLAVYETEPVDSLLDIFWETATSGLISELNTAVAVDNANPAFLGDTEYSQKENQIATGITATSTSLVSAGATSLTLSAATANLAIGMEIYLSGARVASIASINGAILTISAALISVPASSALVFQSNLSGNQYGRYVTDFFYAKRANGAELTTADIALTSVVSNIGTNLTSKFGLYVGTTAADGAINNKAVRIFIKESTFNFIENSLIGSNGAVNARDRYTFTLGITPVGGTATPLTTLGSLINITPSSTPVTMTSNSVNTAVGSMVASNGSSFIGGTTTGLNFVFDTNGGALGVVPTGINGQPGFVITSSGEITQTTQNNNQGSYSIGVKITDATASNGDGGDGAISIFVTQIIVIGSQGVNSTALTLNPCVADVVIPRNDSNTIIDRACVANGSNTSSPPAIYTGVWYIAGSILASSALPVTPVMETSSGTTIANAYRLGTAAHKTGTIAFLLNSRIFKNSNLNINPRAQLTWRIWRREEGQGLSAWTEAFKDVNNFIGSGGVPVQFNSTYGASQGQTLHNQVVKAYARGGSAANLEYCIAATSMTNTIVDGSTTEKAVAWVQSTDLNNAGCVVDNGSVIVSTYSANTYYQYRHVGGQTQMTCGTSSQGPLFSSIPYGEYIDQLFTTTARNSAWTPVNYDASTPYYRWNVHEAGVVGGSALTTPFSTLVFAGRFNSGLGSVYRVASESPNVYSCWSGTSVATAVQRIGKN